MFSAKRVGVALAVLLALVVALSIVLLWGSPEDGHGHDHAYKTHAEAEAHASIGSPACIRFGGCGYLDRNDHRLIAVDNFGDGRKIISVGRGCGRQYAVADPDGKGGRAGYRTVNCDLKAHWLERISRDGLVSKFSGVKRHPG